jgi:AcrR family transcriptional regulator
VNVNLREKQTAERRRRILDSAARLIRKTGGTDFPMLALAAKAEVSPATPYNLFGSKAGVLYALLNRSLDHITREALTFASVDPFEQVLEAAGIAADLFARDPGFFRPLFQFLLGVRDVVHRPRFMDRSLEYWRHALLAAVEGGLLPPEADREELARELLIHFAGVLELWIHKELDEEAFRAQILYGTTLLLLGLARGDAHRRLRKTLKTIKRKLPQRFTFASAGASHVEPRTGSAA